MLPDAKLNLIPFHPHVLPSSDVTREFCLFVSHEVLSVYGLFANNFIFKPTPLILTTHFSPKNKDPKFLRLQNGFDWQNGKLKTEVLNPCPWTCGYHPLPKKFPPNSCHCQVSPDYSEHAVGQIKCSPRISCTNIPNGGRGVLLGHFTSNQGFSLAKDNHKGHLLCFPGLAQSFLSKVRKSLLKSNQLWSSPRLMFFHSQGLTLIYFFYSLGLPRIL